MTPKEFRETVNNYIENHIKENKQAMEDAKAAGCVESEKYCDGKIDTYLEMKLIIDAFYISI